MELPPASSSTRYDTRESKEVRASILDACVQLGALDENSLISEWMFNEPFAGRRTPRSHGTRFQEILSALPEDDEDCESGRESDEPSRGWFPFHLFSRSNKPKVKHTSTRTAKDSSSFESCGEGKTEDVEQSESVDTSKAEGKSFFRRRSNSKSKSAEQSSPRSWRTTHSTRQDSGYASVEPLLLSRRPGPEDESDSAKFSPPAVPSVTLRSTSGSTLADVAEEESDEDWEASRNFPTIGSTCVTPDGVRSQDPRRHTVQQGLSQSIPRFTLLSRKHTPSPPPSPSPSPVPPRRNPMSKWARAPSPSGWPQNPTWSNKRLAENTHVAHMRHGHTRSISLPSSPLILPQLRSPCGDSNPATHSSSPGNYESISPRQASQVVFSDDAAVPERTSTTYTHSMGYHHQFFENPATVRPFIARSGSRNNGRLQAAATVGNLPAKSPLTGMKKG